MRIGHHNHFRLSSIFSPTSLCGTAFKRLATSAFGLTLMELSDAVREEGLELLISVDPLPGIQSYKRPGLAQTRGGSRFFMQDWRFMYRRSASQQPLLQKGVQQPGTTRCDALLADRAWVSMSAFHCTKTWDSPPAFAAYGVQNPLSAHRSPQCPLPVQRRSWFARYVLLHRACQQGRSGIRLAHVQGIDWQSRAMPFLGTPFFFCVRRFRPLAQRRGSNAGFISGFSPQVLPPSTTWPYFSLREWYGKFGSASLSRATIPDSWYKKSQPPLTFTYLFVFSDASWLTILRHLKNLRFTSP